MQSPSLQASRTSRMTIRMTRSAFNYNVRALPEFEECQDYPFEFKSTFRESADYKDISNDPSYTDFKIPYNILCQMRYSQMKAKMEEQFQEEFRKLLRSMESAYEAARFMRHMTITTFWPPLHNRSEIQRSQTHFFKLKKKREKRLNYLMTTNII